MKKTILSILLMVAPFAVHAQQLSVASTGKMAIGPYAPLSSSQLAFDSPTQYGGYKHSLNVGYVPTSGYLNTVSFSSVVSATPQTTGCAIGVQGIGGNRGLNFGVLGGIVYSRPGVGICGTVGPIDSIPTFTGRYAGYFNGDVYISGSLTPPSSLYMLQDNRLIENISAVNSSKARTTELANVMNMNVIKYSNKNSSLKDNHYGLSAQELQKLFPELVVEGQDGYLCIMYMEMVPVLIRTIQELKQEIDDVVKSKYSTGNYLYNSCTSSYQDATNVYYSLADNARNASICLFDMAGKLLRDMPVSSGSGRISINGSELGEGMYLYSLVIDGREVDTKRMIITK